MHWGDRFWLLGLWVVILPNIFWRATVVTTAVLDVGYRAITETGRSDNV